MIATPADPEELDEPARSLVDAVGRARFYVAEGERERFEAITMPQFVVATTLEPEVRAWWTKRVGATGAREVEAELGALTPDERRARVASIQFQFWVENDFSPWLERKREALERAEKLYRATIEEGVPEWAIASSFRIGELAEAIVAAFDQAPMDPSIERDRELIEIYRSTIDSAAEPYRLHALRAYEHCLLIAAREKTVNRWSRACATRLTALAPREHPLGDELVKGFELFDDGFALPWKLLRPSP